nr:MAG TPA: restriction alleviation protein [Bacteriophage sp.]
MMCRLRYTSEIWPVLTYHRKQLKHCRFCGYNVLVFICPHYGFDSHIAGIELAMDDVRSQNA